MDDIRKRVCIHAGEKYFSGDQQVQKGSAVWIAACAECGEIVGIPLPKNTRPNPDPVGFLLTAIRAGIPGAAPALFGFLSRLETDARKMPDEGYAIGEHDALMADGVELKRVRAEAAARKEQ